MAIADISAQMWRGIVERELGYYRGALRRKVSAVCHGYDIIKFSPTRTIISSCHPRRSLTSRREVFSQQHALASDISKR